MDARIHIALLVLNIVLPSNVSAEATDFAEKVVKIEKEIETNEPSANVVKTEEIREHLNQFYHETCTLTEALTYKSYFTPNVRVNTGGKRFDRLETTLGSCHTDKFKVWEIEAHEETAIALVIGDADVQQSNNIPWVAIHEIVKTKDDGWKTDIKFLLIDVNFYDEEARNDKGKVSEIKDFLQGYFRDVYYKGETFEDFQSFFSNGVKNNMAGKKYSGSKALTEFWNDISRSTCKVQKYDVVKIETYGERALALAIGYADIDGTEHRYVQIFELVKQPEERWKIDTMLLFVRFQIP